MMKATVLSVLMLCPAASFAANGAQICSMSQVCNADGLCLQGSKSLSYDIDTRANDGTMTIEGLAPIFMEFDSSSREDLTVTLKGRDEEGETHLLTLTAIRTYSYEHVDSGTTARGGCRDLE